MNDDLDDLLSVSDAEFFKATGNCGACGSPVQPLPGLSWRRLCNCTGCGCGPHEPLDLPRAVVPHTQTDLFGDVS